MFDAGWIALMVMTGLVEFWMLLIFAVVIGAAFAFAGPARMAFTTDVVGAERLSNAIALQQLSMRSTQVIGPALAGVLISIAFIGIAGAYVVTTIGFAVTALSMAWLPAGQPQPREEATSPLADLAQGVRYVRRNGAIGMLLLMSFVVIGLGFSFEAFLVALSEDVFDAGTIGFGALSAATAVGALLAALVVAGYVDHPRAWAAQLVLAVAFGLSLVGLGAAPVFALALVMAALLGAFSSGFQTINSSLVMTKTSRQYQGRVNSISMLGFSLFGFTALPVGIIADAVGLRATLMTQGGILAALMVVLGTWSILRGAARRGPSPPGPERVPAQPAAGGG
jgi:MFS family permease